MRALRLVFPALAAVLWTGIGWSAPTGTRLTVYAAASLTEALQACADRYTAKTGVAVRLSFAASSALARQIEAGAEADVYIPADSDWMDYLAERNLIQASSRRDLLGNRLVLIAAAGDAVQLPIVRGFPLAAALGPDRLAIADPDAVPAGRYGQAALQALGVWDAVRTHLARAENVRMALQYVARGEARLGIVYATDARADARVRIVDTFPEQTHPPIRYPAALTQHASGPAADFLQYLSSDAAAPIWAQWGFRRL